jgi:hypothetical protein
VTLASRWISWMRAAWVSSRKFPPSIRSTATIDSGPVSAPAEPEYANYSVEIYAR